MTIKKNAAAAYFFRLFCISNPFSALTSFFVYFQLSIFILDDTISSYQENRLNIDNNRHCYKT